MLNSSLLDYIRLPAEITDFERDYLDRMNRVALGFFWLNLPLFVCVAFFNDTGPIVALLLTALTLAGPSAAVALLDQPRTISLVHGFTAMCMGGLLVHFGQGPIQIEMHFYFFSLLAVLAMFGNPMVIIVAAVTVTLHHTVVWALLPRSVFNYDASIWVVAVHAAFVVVESVAACFIARSFYDNVIGLEKLVQARTLALEQRNQDLRTVFDNIQQGFLTVRRDGTLSEERSAVVDRWLTPGAATLTDLVTPVSTTFAEILGLGLEVVFDGFLPVEVSLQQLPRQLRTPDRILDFEFQAIGADEDDVESLLLIISDVTAEVRQSESEARQRELTNVFQRFLEDKLGFVEFFADASRMVEDLSTQAHDGDLVVAKRWLHTLKGNCALFGLERIAQNVHEIENHVIEEQRAPTPAAIAELEDDWTKLRGSLEDLIGERSDGIELSEREYRQLIDAIERNRSRDDLLDLIRAWRMEPAELRMGRLKDQALGIASRIDKPDVVVEIDAQDVRLASPRFQSFWSSFVHVLRNALDHGIESRDERTDAGKTGPGRLKLSAHVEDGLFIVTINDDGRGIDWPKIEERAQRLGLPVETEEQRVAALFTDGLTTRDRASLVSGRGVGLGAVQQAVEELGGRIELRSVSGEGTEFRFEFPLDRLQGAVWIPPTSMQPLPGQPTPA